MGRLDNPVPLGYSSAGVVLEVGAGVAGFSRGDRVACSGSGHASHAEIVRIPLNMAARIPDGVPFEEAAFVTLGGIALHGVRLAEPTLGERIVVLGLGLLGQVAVQILKANGCRVLGADLDPEKVALARTLGADAGSGATLAELVPQARGFTGGAGADAVLIFAATPGNEPIELAAEVARERGRIIVPGLVGLDIPRKVFYEKELSFGISRAWGPGMYDLDYEERGIDYPASFVRWTARRNMEAFLELLEGGAVRVAPLITHRFPFEQAVEVYTRLMSGKEKFTGVVLNYPEQPDAGSRLALKPPTHAAPAAVPASRASRAPIGTVRIGLVGAGLFARGTLLPALKGVKGCELRGIATASGASARHVARKYGLSFCATRASEIMESPEIDLVMILTRHGSHARLAAEALRSGKHVFLEKPLALDEEQLAGVIEAYRAGGGELMVGFNRRFAPTTQEALRLLEGISDPLVVTIRANTGYLPPQSWVHDPAEGGGPIVGEACHFFDLAQALTRSLPVRVHAQGIRPASGDPRAASDVTITLQMANGSVATIVYATGGDKGFPRERVELFGGGAAGAIENFRTLFWSQGGRIRRSGGALTSVDRGHHGEMKAMIEALRGGRPFPVRFEEYVAATRATFAALESLRTGLPVDLSPSPDPAS
jgi:predicted dehydrogenase/threonine dehydrogenase-like Zn-dependent dehydrogenase